MNRFALSLFAAVVVAVSSVGSVRAQSPDDPSAGNPHGAVDPHPHAAGDPHPHAAGEPHAHGAEEPSGADRVPSGGAPAAPSPAPPSTDPHLGVPGAPPMPGARQPAEQLPHDLPRALQRPSFSEGRPSADVPAGTIRVTVIDPAGDPIADAAVDVGVMGSGGERSRHNARTNADGVATFSELPTGTSQAYRVNVPHEGAVYGANPFQLPATQGYEVRVVRYPVTRNRRSVFISLLNVFLELKDERIHVIYRVELTNASAETYVFPEGGIRASLPDGALNFQSMRVMSDQRIEEADGGFTIDGSVPLGTTSLAWGFDVRVSGGDLELDLPVPIPAMRMQIISERTGDLEIEVDDFPPAQARENQGTDIWVTGVERRPDDVLESIHIEMTGIPTPGPLRIVAVVATLLMIGLGIGVAMTRPRRAHLSGRATRLRRKALLSEARLLDKELKRAEIGPRYHRRRREEIIRELALVLRAENDQAKAKKASQAASDAAGKSEKPAERPRRSRPRRERR